MIEPVFAVISDTVWNAIIGAVVTLAMAYMSQRNKKAIDEVKVQGGKNHDLLNAKMGTVLSGVADALNLAAKVNNDPGTIKAAENATKAFADHTAEQASIDAKKV